MAERKAPDENKQFHWDLANAGNAVKSAGSISKSPEERAQWKQKARELLGKARETRVNDKVKRLPEDTNEIVTKALDDDAASVVDAVTKALTSRAASMVQAKFDPLPEPDHSEETTD